MQVTLKECIVDKLDLAVNAAIAVDETIDFITLTDPEWKELKHNWPRYLVQNLSYLYYRGVQLR